MKYAGIFGKFLYYNCNFDLLQVVTKLRTLAFIKDTNHLNDFLSKMLLDK